MHAALEGDWERIEPAMAANFALAVLELYALVRFSEDVDWDRTNGWIYLAIVLGLGVMGAYGWWESSRPISSDQRDG